MVKNPGDYTLETYTGEIITIKITGTKTYCHPQADLAEIKFISNQDYPKVQLWDSTRLTQGDTVYVAGWKGNDKFKGLVPTQLEIGIEDRIIQLPPQEAQPQGARIEYIAVELYRTYAMTPPVGLCQTGGLLRSAFGNANNHCS